MRMIGQEKNRAVTILILRWSSSVLRFIRASDVVWLECQSLSLDDLINASSFISTFFSIQLKWLFIATYNGIPIHLGYS